MDKNDLQNLKTNYKMFQEKYSLPDFHELNKEFGIEKAAEDDTDFLLREIRKFLSEKFSNYLRFVELLINPSGASVFIFSIIISVAIFKWV